MYSFNFYVHDVKIFSKSQKQKSTVLGIIENPICDFFS